MPMISEARNAPYGTPIQAPAKPFDPMGSYNQYHDALSGLKKQRFLGEYISKMNGQNQQPNALSGLNDGISLAMAFHNMNRQDELEKAYRTSIANKTPFQMPEQKPLFSNPFSSAPAANPPLMAAQNQPGNFTAQQLANGLNNMGNMAGDAFKAFKFW